MKKLLCIIWMMGVVSDGMAERFSMSNADNWIPRLTKDDLQGYTLVSRIPLTSLYKFNFYRDVSLLYFSMPVDTTEVQFFFKAHEEKINILGGKCVPQDIDIHLKAGGIPVVSPQNITFPEDFLPNDARNSILSFKMKSDESNNSIIIKNPVPGDWFGIAFVSWTDPKSDKIEQQGIAAVCDTLVYTDMRVKKMNVSIITCDSGVIPIQLTDTTSQRRDMYRCFIDRETNQYSMNVIILSFCPTCRWGIIRVQGRAFPDKRKHLIECGAILNMTLDKQEYILDISPNPKEWHYVEVIYGSDEDLFREVSNMKPCREKPDYKKIEKSETEVVVYDLVRDTKSEYFTFEYNLHPNQQGHTPTLLNLTSDTMTSMKFTVHPKDIGGTLSLGVTLKVDLKYYLGYRREKNEASEYYFTEKEQFYKVVFCASRYKRHIPTVNETCDYDGKSLPATVVVNSTDSDSVSTIVHVPYPEVGVWYITLALFCDKDTVCPCRTVENPKDNSTRYLVKPGGRNMTGAGENIRIGSSKCNTSVVFSVASYPCMGGKCGRNGVCNYYMSGGFIYSSCTCRGGYAGWDCTDTSNVTPPHQILMATLFLTLSNLLFIPSIYFAIRRQYYTEATVYFFTMFFSTFYHACDVGDANYSMCIVRLGVLQYSDFFCGLLSFWVTLVAMASLDPRTTSILHMFGAVLIAFGTELNKQALLVFLIPVLTGVIIVGVAWGLRCRQTHKLFPAKAYLVLYLPIGLVLAAIGLVCFAFLQTNANYHIVHSIWHMIIALSILCFLPNRAIFFPKS